jgi:hypothetical protein
MCSAMGDLTVVLTDLISSVSENVVPLITGPGTSLSRKYVQILGSREGASGDIPIKMTPQDIQDVPMVPMKFGSQQLTLVLDTGSSDTWVASTGLECKTRSGRCKFGPTYTKSSTFAPIPNQIFNASFLDGEYMTGIMATETVTIGNITVKDQHIGVVDKAKWSGDGVSSGLFGLGFPSITRAFNSAAVMQGSNIPYDTLFINMFKKGLVAPYFSIAFNRQGEPPGAFALGGLPGAPIRYSSTFVRAPMQEFAFDKRPTPKYDNATIDYKIYAVTANGFTLGTASSPIETMKTQVIIDSGSTMSYLPELVVLALYKAFSPPLIKDGITGSYRGSCTAKAPKFGVKFGGSVVYFDPKDLIAPAFKGATGDFCVPTIRPSAAEGKRGTPAMLSQPFLKNVVAVFDIGAAEMRFANRVR